MKIDFTGDVVRVCPTKTLNNGNELVEVHLSYMDGEYEQVIPVQFWGDKVVEAKALNQGDTIQVLAFMGGREWDPQDGRPVMAFLSLKAYKMRTLAAAEPPAQPAPQAQRSIKQQVMAKAAKNNVQTNDLPWD